MKLFHKSPHREIEIKLGLHLINNPEILAYAANIDNLYKISQLPSLKSKIAIDLGAHAGLFSLCIAKKGCIVHAYEPHEGNYQNLLAHIQVNGLHKIVPFKEAVWNNNGAMHLSLDPDSESSDSHTLSDMSGWKKVKAKTTTPESVFARALGTIAYLKVNCEGGEYCVLKYLVNHARTLNRIERMCIEIHPNMLQAGQFEEIAGYLEQVKKAIPKIKVMFASSFTKGISSEVIKSMEIDTL